MNQEEIEDRVRGIFERQGFQVDESGNSLTAEKDDVLKQIQVFSSDSYSRDEVFDQAEADLVFVDEPLGDPVGELDAEVSVLEEEDEEEYDLPSFEVIGDVAVINELVGVSREEAVEGILHYNPNVETVLLKTEPLSGEFRVGEYEKLHGDETETVHTEFGCDFRVDPTEVYYSERFSTERKRVVDQIEDGEKVLVMFAGVGPFAILAAELAKPEKVVAVEKNPVAADYMKENVEMNDVAGIVEPHEGDVRDVVPELDEEFDRVIMPLPEKAEDFLEIATEYCVNLVHLYSFDFPSIPDGGILVDKTDCGSRAPGQVRTRYDIRVD